MFDCVILAHGNLGNCLKDTVEQIMGKQLGMTVVSNQSRDLQGIVSELEEVVLKSNQNEIFLFVDLYGGSCWQAAKRFGSKKENVVLVTGVNLPMLVQFFSKRDKLNKFELLEKVVESGKSGIITEF
jgi:PTS system mannose-specific IIA component/PTS system mannose-specific IIB component